jgi:cellulose biosynthesis protein BcsQ
LDISAENNKMHGTMVNSDNINSLLADARTRYDLVLLDIPFEKLLEYPSVIFASTLIPFVINPDEMSMINTVVTLDADNFEETNHLNLFLSKTCLILNKFDNNLGFNLKGYKDIPKKLRELSGENSFDKMIVAGSIPATDSFGQMTLKGNLAALCSRKDNDSFFKLVQNLYSI